jgi:predicted enzyme related to lactoylglutathione lyase
MGRPVVHWEIAGANAEKLSAFYSEMFGWKVDANNPMKYGMVETGGEGGINGGIYANEDKSRQGLTYYVQVEDLEAALKKAEGLGGKRIMEPMPIPDAGISIAMFTDPEGNRIGLLTSTSS